MRQRDAWRTALAIIALAGCSTGGSRLDAGGNGAASDGAGAGGQTGGLGGAPTGSGAGGRTGGAGGAPTGSGAGGAGNPDAGADVAPIRDAQSGIDAFDAAVDRLPIPDAGAGLAPVFNGQNLDGWIQVPPSSWSIVNGAMHSLGTARGFIYSAATYGDFRMVFTSRLVADPAAHLPCVLFWGTSTTLDAMAAIQIQPPRGFMWDYRRTGPTANMSPDRFETRLGGPALSDAQWTQCEILTNHTTGTMRFACCALNGAARCKGVEIVDFKDPTAGVVGHVAFQVHNAAMIEEFKDVYIESPVADPAMLVTPQWP